MEDMAIRATAFDGQVRVVAATSTQTVNDLQKRHHTWPVASAALGRTVTAAAMMGQLLKGDQKVMVEVKGDGPLEQIVAEASTRGEVRGYVGNPFVDLPLNDKGKLDVARAVGEGSLYVTKDLGVGTPYRGSVPLVSGELGEDLTNYFTTSEQIPSSVGLGVLVNPDNTIRAAGGFILQLMPEAGGTLIDRLEQNLAELPPVSQQIDDGADAVEMIYRVLGTGCDLDARRSLKIYKRIPLRFQCRCSVQRVRNMLKNFGVDELTSLLHEQGQAEVICHFCNERYLFSAEDLQQLIEAAASSAV